LTYLYKWIGLALYSMECIKLMSTRLLTFVVIVLLFAGCVEVTSAPKTSLGCDSILNTPFRPLIGMPLTTEQTLQIIEKAYGVRPENVDVRQFPKSNEWTTVIRWTKRKVSFYLFWNRERLQRSLIVLEEVKPSAQTVIHCVGSSPKWYRAFYGPRIERKGLDYYFELWFPDEGVVTQTRGTVRDQSKLPDINSTIPIDYIDIVNPGTVEQVYTNLGIGSGTLPPDEENPLKPWPEDWDEIQFINGW